MKEYLTTVFAAGTHGLKVGVKLKPYFYDGQFVEAAGVLNEFYPNLSFITSINTIGCYGGLGGPAVHATALGNVRRLRELLRRELDVVGCGDGVLTVVTQPFDTCAVWCSHRHGGERLVESRCKRFGKD